MQLGPGASAAQVHSLALQFSGCWLFFFSSCFLGLEVCPGRSGCLWGSWAGEGVWQQNLLPPVPPSVPPPPIHPKSTGSGSLGDLGVCFPQRSLGKLIPEVSWWGGGDRRRGAGAGEKSGWGSASGEELQPRREVEKTVIRRHLFHTKTKD